MSTETVKELEAHIKRGEELGVVEPETVLGTAVKTIGNGIKKHGVQIATTGIVMAGSQFGAGCASKKAPTVYVDNNSAPMPTKTLDEVLKETDCTFHELIYKSGPKKGQHFNSVAGRGDEHVKYLVLHITGYSGSSANNTFTNDKEKKSAHRLYMENGERHKYLNYQDTSWSVIGHNQESINFEFACKFGEHLTEAQIEAAVPDILYVMYKYSLTIDDVKRHPELQANKVCMEEEDKERIIARAIKEVNSLPVASAEKYRLLGVPLENAVASYASLLEECELKQDIVYGARTHIFTEKDRNAWSVSRQYGIDWKDFVAANPNQAKTDFKKMHKGDVLNIPGFRLSKGQLLVTYKENQLDRELTIDWIETQVKKYKSEMDAEYIFDATTKCGINPVWACGIFKEESGFGTTGLGKKNKNPGNIKISNKEFAKYSSFEAGVEAFCQKIKGAGYMGSGRITHESIDVIYAPASDGNSAFSRRERVIEAFKDYDRYLKTPTLIACKR